jgi:hypothetical protein
VIKWQDKTTKEFVAIKEIPKPSLMSQSYQETVEREISLLA